MRNAGLLLPPDLMPHVSGLHTPDDLYTVTLSPAPLAGMRHPTRDTPWMKLKDAGFDAVICLTDTHPAYDPSPLRLAYAVTLEDLFGGRMPVHPNREARAIEHAVGLCLRTLREGEGVVVHCVGGTGRTGTVLAAALAELGGNLDDIVTYLDTVDRLRGTGWPESPWQEKTVRRVARGS